MTIHAFTDGASRGNPGESGVGVILKDEHGKTIEQVFGYLGKTTNNVAEYTALLTCLQMVEQKSCKQLVVYSDSELLVRQLKGEYKVKDRTLKQYAQRVHEHLQRAPYRFTIKHVLREHNKEADALANRGIDSKVRLQLDLPLFRQA